MAANIPQELAPALAELEGKLRNFVTEQYLKPGQQIPPLLSDVIADVSRVLGRARGWRPTPGSFLADAGNRRELTDQVAALAARLDHYTADSYDLAAYLADIQSGLESVLYFLDE